VRRLARRAGKGYHTLVQTSLVITLIGPDRTGLVETVARAIAGHGGNWLESRLCRLGGEFAGILHVDVPPEQKPALLAALQKIPALQVTVRADETKPAPPPAGQIRLEIVGHDRPGIVREITAVLARAGVNVEEFSSEIVSAPMTGENLFQAQARLQLPPPCDLAALRNELEKIAADLQVDISLAEWTGGPPAASGPLP
jgi:glycine cleavage system regulatory protein